MTSMTPAELKAQAAALLAQAEAAEQTEKEAAEKAKKEAAEAKRIAELAEDAAKRKAINESILVELKKIFPTITFGGFSCFEVDGVSVSVDFEKQYINSTRYSYGSWTGQYRVVAGDWGSRVSYPPRKDGTHNYVKIAERLQEEINKRLFIKRNQEATQANKSSVDKLREELGLKSWDERVSSSTDTSKPIRVTLKLTADLTEEKAREVLALWNQIQATIKG